MPITELLERNAKEFGSETALVEINPEVREVRRVIEEAIAEHGGPGES